jgi:RNA polymerase sigma-70 factor (ECF subfamily)
VDPLEEPVWQRCSACVLFSRRPDDSGGGSSDGGLVSREGEQWDGAAGYGQLDEATVLSRLRDGDEALFRELVVALTPVLTRLARSYTPTTSAAQDAVQDTWLVVLDKLDTFEGRSSLKTWICGILVNKARRSGLREHRTVPFTSVWREDHSPSVDPGRFHAAGSEAQAGTWASPPVRWDTCPEEQLASAELRRVIERAIAALPTRQREVITARDVLGMDAEEAAVVLRLSAGNQRVLLHRARSKVRTSLEQYGVDLPDQPPTGTRRGPAAGPMRPAPGPVPPDQAAPPRDRHRS